VEVTEVLEGSRGLLWHLRRLFPDVRWEQPLSSVRDVDPAFLRGDAISVKVQLLRAEGGYERWPTEERELDLRYADCGRAVLSVPTLPAFAAMKTSAWFQRREPRDLWDLARLAELDAIGVEAAELVRGALGLGVAPHFFDKAPSESEWRTSLAGQTAKVGDPTTALEVVRTAWEPQF
jgi:hypothetical protein